MGTLESVKSSLATPSEDFVQRLVEVARGHLDAEPSAPIQPTPSPDVPGDSMTEEDDKKRRHLDLKLVKFARVPGGSLADTCTCPDVLILIDEARKRHEEGGEESETFRRARHCGFHSHIIRRLEEKFPPCA